MKYSINHPWKFESWWGAFNCGLLQFTILLLVEFVSMMVLLLQQSVLDVLMNFLALTIITEFDDYLFETLYNDPISHLIKDGVANFGGKERQLSDIVKIETTTSNCARFKIEGNRFGALVEVDEDDKRNPEEFLSTGSATGSVKIRLSNRDSRASWAD